MFRLNFERSLVLRAASVSDDGKVKIETAFHGSISLPRNSVRLVTTKHLNDMSTRVVDFGRLKKGKQPTAAIIAAGRKDRLPQF